MIELTAAPDGQAAADLIETIKTFFEGFDPNSLLPNLSKLLTDISLICRIALYVGPVLLMVLGLGYLFLAPKEANWYFGYHTYFGMGSVEAWQFTQHLSGIVFAGLGAILLAATVIVDFAVPTADVNALVWRCVYCLAAQAGLALLAVLFLNVSAMLRYDAKGRRKRRK